MSKKILKSYPKSVILDILNILDHDPLSVIVEIAKDATTEKKLRYEANKELLSYLVSKPKKIEFSVGDSDSKAQQQMLELVKLSMAKHRKDY